MVTVEFSATVRLLTGEEPHPADGPPAKLGELPCELRGRDGPAFEAAVPDGQQRSRRVLILVNSRNALSTGRLQTPLARGDEISAFPLPGSG